MGLYRDQTYVDRMARSAHSGCLCGRGGRNTEPALPVVALVITIPA